MKDKEISHGLYVELVKDFADDKNETLINLITHLLKQSEYKHKNEKAFT